MSQPTCDEIRAFAPEVALGVAPGDERARVLAHVASCGGCAAFLAELSETADALLLLAPEHEPPEGFEGRVLTQTRRPRRRLARTLAVAAAVVLAIGGTVAGMRIATSGERADAARYRDVLARANGSWMGSAVLRTADGSEAGHVIVYEGEPSWLFVAASDGTAGEWLRIDVLRRGQPPVRLNGGVRMRESGGWWGGLVAFDPRAITDVHLVQDDGTVAYRGTLTSG